MREIETNDWILLNSIIYKIHTMNNVTQMRQQILEQIRLLVDFDSADFYLSSNDGEYKLTSPVFYNCEEDLSDLYDELDYSRGILYSGKSIVYKETDIISDEKRVATEYYQKVYKPNNWHYSLHMVMGREKEFVGVITLYRVKGKNDFQYEDIFIMDLLKDHLSFRLYQNKQRGDEKLTVLEAVDKFGLTRREHTILKLLMEGMENSKISEKLMITENTLKKHILNIYRKLGIKNRVQMFKLIREQE